MSQKFSETSYKEWIDWAVTTYEQQNPGVTIQEVPGPNYEVTLKADVAAGSGVPDVVNLDSDTFQQTLTAAGDFLDLTPFIKGNPAYAQEATFFSAVPQPTYMYKGDVYQAVVDVGPSSIYYWKDLFAKAGAVPPATVDDMYALVPKFKAIGVDTMVSGLSTAALWQDEAWFWQLAANVDYKWVADKQVNMCTAPWVGDAVALQALTTFAKLYQQGVLRKQSPQEAYDPAAKQAFYNQQAAMFYSGGPWLNGGFTAADIGNVGIIPNPPAAAGGKYSIVSIADENLGVLNVTSAQKDPAHQAAVVKFTMFLAGLDSQKEIWKVGRAIPVNPAAVAAPTNASQVLLQEVSNIDSSPLFQPIMQVSLVPQASNALGNGVLGLMLGAKTPAQVLSDIDTACAGIH